MTFTGKVLLTDDEAHIRKFVGLVLHKLGRPTVLEAPDGAAAITLYEQHRPGLVLLDVNMPNIDGVQALEKIMQINPDAVVIMLTSLTNRQTVEECLRLGASGYIRKDTPRDEMILQLQGIIDDCFGENPPPAP